MMEESSFRAAGISHARVDPDAAALVKAVAQHFIDSGLSQASAALEQARPPAPERSRLR
jgi:hypothetical protein